MPLVARGLFVLQRSSDDEDVLLQSSSEDEDVLLQSGSEAVFWVLALTGEAGEADVALTLALAGEADVALTLALAGPADVALQ